MNLKEQIEKFIPFNEQEINDKEQFLKFIDTFDDVLTRDNIFGHFSASAFVVNKERTKMLVVYHIINDGWIHPGGHADGEEDLLAVTVREVEEETGLKAKVLDENIYSIQSEPVKGHIKRGKYVSAHLHLDIIYLMEADDNIPLIYREEESKGVKWVDFAEATDETMCDFVRPTHAKLIDKLIK
ncbi:MAG: NUDIX domain-containing protein [Clostridiales bacterium]|nr:NUDIX domain-containing protein [Clostridiales bacterium]